MLMMEFLATVLFLWVVKTYPTPLHIGLGLALALYLGGKHLNPAISFMKFLGGRLSQQGMLQMVVAQLAAAFVVVNFL